MKYLKTTIKTNTAGTETVPACLLDLGITDVVIEDPEEIRAMVLSPRSSEWFDETQIPEIESGEPAVIVYAADDEAGRRQAQRIAAAMEALREEAAAGLYGAGFDLGSLAVETIEESDEPWRDKWKEFFKPTRITERIIVKPTWCEYPEPDRPGAVQPQPDDVVIEIDPGMAFGTGTHETTSLALKLLEKYLRPQDRVLDIGVGSGILSIAAAKLGCRSVIGVDIDPDAVRVARENLELNRVSALATAEQGDLTEGLDLSAWNGEKADLVVANLLANLVVRLTPAVPVHLKTGGLYLTSGILTVKQQEVAAALTENGFRVLEIKEDGEWCAIAAVLL